MKNRILSIFIILTLLATSTVCLIDSSDGAENGTDVLFDYGNGKTVWDKIPSVNGKTNGEVLKSAAEANGIKIEFENNTITIDGNTSAAVGGGSGNPSFTAPGVSSVKVVSQWNIYSWESGKWIQMKNSELDSECKGNLAVGFYPNGMLPTETPEYPDSWTMIQGDSGQTGTQFTKITDKTMAEIKWVKGDSKSPGLYASALVSENKVFIKFGASTTKDAHLDCYDRFTGNLLWTFEYPGMVDYEITSGLIVGGHVYLPTTYGYIFKIPVDGPGENNSDVTTFNGTPFDYNKVESKIGGIPYDTGADLSGFMWNVGVCSITFDSGCLFVNASNGMTYCFDTDLKLIWSQQAGGRMYFVPPTVHGDLVLSGSYDGKLYVMDKSSGKLLDSVTVYTETYNGIPYGAVIGISVFGDSSDCKIIVSFNSGKGMSSMKGGVAIYSFDGKLTEVYKNDTDFGLVANYFNPLESDGFTGVYFVSSRGLFKIDTDGKWELLNDSIGPIKAGMTLVNGEYLYGTYYKTGKSVVVLDLNGNIVKEFGEQPESIANYCMTSAIVIGNWIYTGTDRGAYSVYGELPEISPASHETPWYSVLLMLIGAIVAIFAGLYAVMRFGMKIEHPFSRISEKYQNYFHGEKLSHGSRNRHRLYLMLLIGFAGTAVTFVICLCLGPTDIMSVPEMLGNLFSAIGKGGNNLTFEELAVYNSRLPRTLAAMFVGIGLSIAGCMYQAIIRNPLVDPYIMGVSAGAGTAAIAVIAFDFTFFGLFSQNSIFLTAISAMVGGVIAFFATMLLAEKAGGNSINYVLAGVVVGLAFSAIQTMMISMAGERISDSMSWLFGSFSNISWTQIGMIVIPTAVMSLIPLIWAKEFNLVLLGEDQAKQMGLDVRRFNRLMLILASVLTSICVAFVGIIGFVGLVVPHLCRMLLGGDHRLVMPASIAVGGLMMMLADLASRMLMHGQELPVGAITTLIGVPVFAYLLIRRGKMYDG